MISYTLDEAKDFRQKILSSPYTPGSFYSNEHLLNFLNEIKGLNGLMNPHDIIEKVIRSSFLGVYIEVPVDYLNKGHKILFDSSLEELMTIFNEPEPFISFIEWRLKLGK